MSCDVVHPCVVLWAILLRAQKYPIPPVDSSTHKAALLGAKLAAGMEMFLCRQSGGGKRRGGGGGGDFEQLHSCLAAVLHLQARSPAPLFPAITQCVLRQMAETLMVITPTLTRPSRLTAQMAQ